MTFPTVTENPAQLEPVVRDPFIQDDAAHAAAVQRDASWPWPTRRPADA